MKIGRAVLRRHRQLLDICGCSTTIDSMFLDSNDRTAELARRASMHAALGEPVRLAIASCLAVTDVSPGQLSATLGLSTNLLAHHLGVLEGAGLIRRVRSEGDRRRTYVQLVLDDPVVTAFVPPLMGDLRPTSRVVFVCTHNSARSQLAAAAWASVSDVPCASAGTRPARRPHPRAVAAGRRHGLRIGRARTAHVHDVLRSGDLVVTVCDNAFEGLPVATGSLHWAVADPVPADTDDAFETAYGHVSTRVARLALALHPR